MKRLVQPFVQGCKFRNRMVKDGKVLCVDFADTLQKKDITKDLIKDVDIEKYVYRVKVNIKDFDSELRSAKGLPPFDFSDEKKISEVLNDHNNFDIPLWFLRKAHDKLENIVLYDLPLIYQIMGCNFHSGLKTGGCVQCYVDDKSNIPCAKRGVFLSQENVANTFEAMKKSQGIRVIRISGGEPTLALDHILAVCREILERKHLVLVQFDTNLSTHSLIKHFEREGVYPENVLERIAEYDPGVLVSFKGTTDQNLQDNTQSQLTIDDQIESLKLFVKAGIDVYPYIYNPDADHLREFMEKLEDVFENILLKTHIVATKIYSPTRERIYNIAKREKVDPEKLLESYSQKWAVNYHRSCEIMNDLLNERYGLAYKQLERPGIKIRLKD